MRKKCENCKKVTECTIKNSCKNMGLDYCRFHDDGISPDVNINKGNLDDLEKLSRPLIKWLCENHHPHMTIIITPTSCELLESKCANPRIDDYVLD